MKNIFLTLCAVLSLAACEMFSNGNDFIEVEPSKELSFESDESTTTLTVTSSGKWTVGELPEWIKVTPTEGEDGDMLTVSVTENPSEEDRTGSFTLTCGTASATIAVIQYGAIQSDYADLGLDETGTSMTYNQNTGVLTVTYAGTNPPEVEKGQAVVLDAEHGYDIRVVESASVSGSTLSLQTSEGNMTDLFKNTSFTLVTSGTADTRSVDGKRIITPSEVGYFDAEGTYHKTYDRSDMTKGEPWQNEKELWSFHTDFDGESIAQGNAGNLYWETCSFEAGLNGKFTFDFGEKKIDEVRSKGDIKLFRYELKGTLDMDFLLHYHYQAEYSEEDDEIIAENVIPTVVFKFMVGTVPVYIQVNTHLGQSTEFSAEGQIDATAGVKLGTEVNMGVEWTKEAGARPILEATPYMEIHHPTLEAEASAEAKVSYYPHIDIHLYKFLGPWIEPRPYIKETVEAGFRVSTDGENHIGWNAETYAGMDLKMGLDLDFGILEFKAWESEVYNPVEEQLLFEAPSRITLVSPENGTEVKPGKTVTAEFLVESYSTLTGEYYPCPFALVNLAVEGGNLAVPIAVSDIEGHTYAEWVPSVAGESFVQTRSESKTQTRTLTAEIVDGFGQSIDNASLVVITEPVAKIVSLSIEEIEAGNDWGKFRISLLIDSSSERKYHCYIANNGKYCTESDFFISPDSTSVRTTADIYFHEEDDDVIINYNSFTVRKPVSLQVVCIDDSDNVFEISSCFTDELIYSEQPSIKISADFSDTLYYEHNESGKTEVYKYKIFREITGFFWFDIISTYIEITNIMTSEPGLEDVIPHHIGDKEYIPFPDTYSSISNYHYWNVSGYLEIEKTLRSIGFLKNSEQEVISNPLLFSERYIFL